ncbi:MAG: hypothetical protein WD431_22700 [Cyclobacteriaceae bacterium]
MSNQLIALNDILPTLAGLVGEKLPVGTAKDGHDLLPAFYGNIVDEGSRESVVVRGSGNSYGLRQGKWKVVQEGDAQPPTRAHHRRHFITWKKTLERLKTVLGTSLRWGISYSTS